MIGFVFAAFRAARLAYFCANLAERGRKLRTATHQRSGGPANLRAVFVEPDALRHHFDVFFSKACVATMLARSSATDTSLDASLELLVSHHSSPVSEGLSIQTAGDSCK
jgi:hypothetical protein